MDLVIPDMRRLRVARFVAAFGLWLAALALVFHATRPWWVTGFMMPLAWAAESALTALGLPARLGEPMLAEGICLLQVESVVYKVTFECTGVFALFICMASILAFPTSPSSRVRGLLMAIPAFVTYAILRLVILGLVAHLSPDHIDLFHAYVMVVANVGFVLALWLVWLQDTRQEPVR